MYPICIETLSNENAHETLLKIITMPHDNLICIALKYQLVCCLDKFQSIIQLRNNFVDFTRFELVTQLNQRVSIKKNCDVIE